MRQADESRVATMVWLVVRHRRVLYLSALAVIVGLGILRDGPGWWLVTVGSAATVCAGLGFVEGMAFVRWSHDKRPWDGSRDL